MEIPIVGGAYTGKSKNLNSQMCQNLYPVLDQEGGKYPVALFGTPGLSVFADSGFNKEVRAMNVMGDYLYACIGNRVYKFSSTGMATLITGNLNSSTGSVWMEDDGVYMVIVDGRNGYYTTGTTLTQITDADFPQPSSLAYQDTFWIVTVAGSDEFYKSASGDPTSWDGLQFSTAEAKPDRTLSVFSFARNLVMFGFETTEIFYNSGNATFPYEKIPGSFSEIGCGAAKSPAGVGDTLCWLGRNRHVYRNEGYRAVDISTSQIVYQIQQFEDVRDAFGFGYIDEGHYFYVLTFPSGDKTFVYDITTSLWHTRASTTQDTRHPANCYVRFSGKHIVGHHTNGKLLYYDHSKYTDDGEVLRAIRRAKAVHKERKRIVHHSLEVEFEAGVGINTGQGSDPIAVMRHSDDGGHTWSNELWESIGKIGEYETRAVWNKLGVSRDRVYEIMITDPVKRVILSANLNVTECTS